LVLWKCYCWWEAIAIVWWGKSMTQWLQNKCTLTCLNWTVQNEREREIGYIHIQKITRYGKGPADVIHMHISRNSNHSRPLVYSASRRLGAWLAHAEDGIHGAFAGVSQPLLRPVAWQLGRVRTKKWTILSLGRGHRGEMHVWLFVFLQGYLNAVTVRHEAELQACIWNILHRFSRLILRYRKLLVARQLDPSPLPEKKCARSWKRRYIANSSTRSLSYHPPSWQTHGIVKPKVESKHAWNFISAKADRTKERNMIGYLRGESWC
jgi:hypothetical protein